MRRLAAAVGAAAVGAAAVLGGCSAGADVKAGEAGVAAFHQEVDQGRFADVYAGAAPEMKAATTPAALTQLLAAIHRKLGPYVSGVRSTWNVNYGTAGKIVTLVYASKYARGEATERFVLRVSGERASLVGFNVEWRALIVN